MVDAGDLFWKNRQIPDATVPQQRLKGELIADAFVKGGIDAMTPGEGDFALGPQWLLETVQHYELPMISANLICGGKAPFQPAKRVEWGGVTLGFIGVTDPQYAPDGCQVLDPIETTRAAVAALGDVDLRVVLSHQDKDADEALAAAVPEIDVVVNGHARLTNANPGALSGDAIQLAAGSRGRTIGVATLTLVPEGQGFAAAGAAAEIADKLDQYRKRLKTAEDRAKDAADGPPKERAERQIGFYQDEIKRLEAELAEATRHRDHPTHQVANNLITLGTDVADKADIQALVDATNLKITALERSGPAPAPLSGDYVGGATCQGCHPGPAAQWATTAHAHAWGTLEQDHRAMDRACFSCHATGVDQPGGPTSPATVGALANVQCEACHGPGKAHVAAPGKGQVVRSPPVAVCTRCHDGIKDEGRFDPEAYLARVRHTDASVLEAPAP